MATAGSSLTHDHGLSKQLHACKDRNVYRANGLPGLTQAVTFRVKVTDTDTNRNAFSSSVTTTVYASPVANAGPDAPAFENTVVTLNGSATRTAADRHDSRLCVDGASGDHIFGYGHVNI